MILTGKCKQDFEKWYNNPLVEHVGLRRLPQWFYTLTDSMQYGIYVDFFDSKGIRVYLRETGTIQNSITLLLYDGDKIWSDIKYNTRQEARTKAIKKANDIYNEN